MFSEKSSLGVCVCVCVCVGGGGWGGTMSLSSESILAWFSDVRGRSQFLRFSPWSERHRSARFAHQYFCYLTTYFAFFFCPRRPRLQLAHKAPLVQAICANCRTGDCSANQHQYPPRIATWLLSCTWWTVMFWCGRFEMGWERES